MRSKKTFLACWTVLVVAGLFVVAPIGAQGGEKYTARLAPAPPLGLGGRGGPPSHTFVAGMGSAQATLSGAKLTITGKFEKMASAATVAKVGLGLATGARLDLILDLKLTKSPDATPAGTSGTIEGTFDLTPSQVEGLKQGKLYIQIDSEGAPNGHLLGWLLR